MQNQCYMQLSVTHNSAFYVVIGATGGPLSWHICSWYFSNTSSTEIRL
jgi:hypothetical protein